MSDRSAKRRHDDLVLTDLEVPGLNGRDTAIAVRLRSAKVSMAAHIARPIAPHQLLRQIERVFCRPATVPEPDPWQRQHYDEWASRLGAKRVDSFLLSLLAQFRALLTLLADNTSEEEAHRAAHDVASTGGMLGFHEVTRCCRALLEASEIKVEVDARSELVHALECAAARLNDHLATVDHSAVAA